MFFTAVDSALSRLEKILLLAAAALKNELLSLSLLFSLLLLLPLPRGIDGSRWLLRRRMDEKKPGYKAWAGMKKGGKEKMDTKARWDSGGGDLFLGGCRRRETQIRKRRFHSRSRRRKRKVARKLGRYFRNLLPAPRPLFLSFAV